MTVTLYQLNARECKSNTREGKHNIVLFYMPYCPGRRNFFSLFIIVLFGSVLLR
jgi:hypothetical protein